MLIAQEYVDKLNDLLTTIEESRVKAIAAIGKNAKSFLSDKKLYAPFWIWQIFPMK